MRNLCQPREMGIFWQEIREGSTGKLHLYQRCRPGYFSCLVLLPAMLGSAPGDGAGTQQDPALIAEAALLILVNLSQFTPGSVAIPPHQTIPYLPHLTFQRGPGGGRTAPGSHGLLPAAASSRPRSCSSANKGVSAPSVPARKGPGPHIGSPVLVTTPLIHHCTCRSREKSISVSTSSSERKGSAEGWGWRGSVTAGFLAATASQGHGRGQNKAIFSVTNESWE